MLRLSRRHEFLSSLCSICKQFSRSLVTMVNTVAETEEVEANQTEKRSLEDETESEAKKQKIETFVRIKRKNFAVMLGYLGKNYWGMQRNPNQLTIEEDLLKAMLKIELITQEHFETIQTIHFQRAARTDKGVSAVRQVVSLLLPENPSKDSINENLPEDIRVFSIKRVTKGFNSKSQCDARTYTYTLPTFAFTPENVEKFQETINYIDEEDVKKRFSELRNFDGKPIEEYRMPEEARQRLNELLKCYHGTRNFHNYTSKTLPLDPRAKRFIMNFVADEPFVVDNIEYVTLKVKGQSFMMHQIRKMVSMIIGVMRNIIPKETFLKTFSFDKFDITRAPSLGLMLSIVHYDYYNKRYGSDGVHEPLDYADCEEEIEQFEKNKILKEVFDTEVNDQSMLHWLSELDYRSYSKRDESTTADKANKEDQEENVDD